MLTPIKINAAKFFSKSKRKDKTTSQVEYTGNAAADSQAEISEVLQLFKDKSKTENARQLQATDSEFWIAVCFQNRKQKEEFLKALDLLPDGDKYLDGRKVAKAIGLKLEATEKEKPARSSKADRWKKLVEGGD